jgi:hypothetical protein
MPLIAELTEKGHRIGVADNINFEYGLNCILDHASQLIEANGSAAPSKRHVEQRADEALA